MARLILVVGGSGRTGQSIVQKLKQSGCSVRVLTRNPKQAQVLFDASVETVAGNITQIQDVEAAMRDVDGVVIAVESADSDDAPNSPEQVHYQGTRHILAAAAKSTGIVLVTQIYITRPDRYPEMSNIIHWRCQAEAAVRSSGLPYTIVRPGWLTNASGDRLVRFEQGDRGEGQVSRETVAEVCVQALHHETARGKTFEIYNESTTSPTDWSAVFASLQPDPILTR